MFFVFLAPYIPFAIWYPRFCFCLNLTYNISCSQSRHQMSSRGHQNLLFCVGWLGLYPLGPCSRWCLRIGIPWDSSPLNKPPFGRRFLVHFFQASKNRKSKTLVELFEIFILLRHKTNYSTQGSHIEFQLEKKDTSLVLQIPCWSSEHNCNVELGLCRIFSYFFPMTPTIPIWHTWIWLISLEAFWSYSSRKVWFCLPGTEMTSIFEGKKNPKITPKFQSKQGSFGFQVVSIILYLGKL